MARLILLFVLVPTLELILLLQVGSLIGVWPTVGIILVTGVLGASLARHQGLAVLHQVRHETAAGQLPGASLVDGALILVAGALLMTPGFLTDLFGFACLIPAGRRIIRSTLWKRVERAVREGQVNIVVGHR